MMKYRRSNATTVESTNETLGKTDSLGDSTDSPRGLQFMLNFFPLLARQLSDYKLL